MRVSFIALFAAFVVVACAKTDAPADSTAVLAPAPDTLPAAAPATSDGLIDPNTATREQLSAVSGMTPAAADAVIAGRPYRDMVAVEKVLMAHIPDTSARETIYATVWKPIDLNKASKEEILLVPGVGPRMQREFEEYRPYPNIEKFRREIGKYVKSDEVARLEKYVAIP